MKVKCEYCDSFIDDFEEHCPNCGAVNENLKRMANGIPKTIEDLKDYCIKQNLPLSMMRFYIGENYKLPKAFGIYKDEDTGEFIVYKNKADGSRAVRYQGVDEAYAVNEIYVKLQEEVLRQKANSQSAAAARTKKTAENRKPTNNSNYSEIQTSGSSNNNKNKNNLKSKIILIIVLIFFGSTIIEMVLSAFVGIAGSFLSGSDSYDSSYSYTYDYDYDYDDDDSWFSDYDSSDSSWDSDWDSDWDSGWDSGSDWDSGFSDWDSDW